MEKAGGAVDMMLTLYSQEDIEEIEKGEHQKV